ncbi:hypothetical protein BC835DRAFT_1303903 [Cytidiella melzeri]|nr:hypothetical protein BC835DRAFT_1303903 [Cytidiella melzeri]
MTYTGRHNSLYSGYDAPLAIVPPPDKLRAFSELEKTSRANIKQSKLLYDVRDAFKNILQVVYLPPTLKRGFPADPCSQGCCIRRLTALCAAVVGEHIEEQVEMVKAEKADEVVVDHEDLEVLNEFYEAVPEHHRKYTMVSHALSIIFSICPPNHTLYHVLLEVTMSYGLNTESEAILYRLLQAASTRMETSPLAGGAIVSPLTLSIHANYLKDLRDRLSESGVVNDRSFARILHRAIAKVPSSVRLEIWTCKAMIRLARRFRSQDYEAFITTCSHLAQDVAEISDSAKGKEREDLAHTRACDRLAKWLEAICGQLLVTGDLEADADTSRHELQATAELLVYAKVAGLHLQEAQSETSKNIADALLCLAVLCLSSSHSSALSPRLRTALIAIVRQYRGADVDTFNPITSILLSNVTKDDKHNYSQMSLQVNISFTALRRCASPLRSKRLYLLEAWFWSNVLAQVEALCPEIGSHYDTAMHRSAFVDELERIRRDTVKWIEEAERSHFAEGGTATCLDQTPSKAALVVRGSEFRWEELVGAWVHKTPLPIKRRRPPKSVLSAEDDEFDVLDRHAAKRPCIFETPLRPRARSIASSTSLSSYVSSRTSTMTPSNSSSRMTTPLEEQENLEEGVFSATTRAHAAKDAENRRHSSFSSILADARANRVVLHAKGGRHAADDTEHKPTVHRPPVRFCPSPPELTAIFPFCDDELSSDDLNLFAYRSSEW